MDKKVYRWIGAVTLAITAVVLYGCASFKMIGY